MTNTTFLQRVGLFLLGGGVAMMFYGIWVQAQVVDVPVANVPVAVSKTLADVPLGLQKRVSDVMASTSLSVDLSLIEARADERNDRVYYELVQINNTLMRIEHVLRAK